MMMKMMITMMLVRKQKMMKVTWAAVPQRASTISQTVCAVRALFLTWMAKTPKRRTWIVAPEAYQKGPDTPYCHATLDDWRSVAAHVHCEQITAAVKPVLTFRPAVLKNSDVSELFVSHLSTKTRAVVKSGKNAPNPSTMA